MSVETPIEPDNARPGKMRIVFALLPLLIFAGLAAIFWSQLDSGRNISEIPSALIGTKAPSLDLPPLRGATFQGAAMPAPVQVEPPRVGVESYRRILVTDEVRRQRLELAI